MSRVLVVEDDPQVRSVVCAILSRDGLSLETAADGEQALERVQGEHFDLVLLDVGLPRLDGLSVLERLQKLENPPKTIMMTGSEAPETVLRAARAQACRYVTKPVDAHVLIDLVHEVLDLEPTGPPIEVVSARPNWVELVIPCTIEAAQRSESFLEAVQKGVQPEVADSIGKAVHELVLNAIEWGGQFDPARRVRISCVRTSRLVLYRISDPGTGFQFDALTHAALSNPPDQPAGHQRVRADKGLRPGGFGIMMVRALVDDLVYNEAQNEVILFKYLA
jgi:CheY-like chemotaxis protein/anti-sigma regulatory factor (Ser/Thr protein kinase)